MVLLHECIDEAGDVVAIFATRILLQESREEAGDVLAIFATMVLLREYDKGNKDYFPPRAGGS